MLLKLVQNYIVILRFPGFLCDIQVKELGNKILNRDLQKETIVSQFLLKSFKNF